MDAKARLIARSASFLQEVKNRTAGAELEHWLNDTYGPGSALYDELAALIKTGVEEGWAANVDRMNLKRRKAFYGDWWDKAAQWRSGGFDRLCAGVPGSPTTEQIRAAGIKGTLFVNEILTVRPGSALEFLAAVAEDRAPLMAEYGHRATGLYVDGMGRTASGSDLGQWSNSNSTNQQWQLVSAS